MKKVCGECGELKHLDDFHRQRSTRDGRQTRCKVCRNAQAREQAKRPERREYMARYQREYEKNPVRKEYKAAYDQRPERRAYRADNPHINWEAHYRSRAKQFGIVPVVEPFTRDELVNRHGDRCHWCGDAWTELDHATPVSKGGEHSLNNCVPSCQPCNRAAFNEIRTIKTLETTE